MEADGSEELFLKYFLAAEPTLRSYLMTMVWEHRDREDTFQDIAVVLWNKFDTFDQSRPFTHWAMGVARNHVLRLRREKATQKLIFTDEIQDMIHETFEIMDDELVYRRSILNQCMAKLEERYQALLQMRYELNYPLQQMADELSMTLNAVNKALGRIRSFLTECTGELLEDA